MIVLYILILLAGFFCLVKGADIFVDGSCALARIFHVSGLVIGLTIVALGTSAPELAVSTAAAVQGSNEIALSNVVGSNLFNLLMVLGFCSVFSDLPVDSAVKNRDFPVSIVATIFVLLVTGWKFLPFGFLSAGMYEDAGTLVRPASIALLVAFVCYIGYLVFHAGKEPDDTDPGKQIPIWKCIVMIIAGLALIVAGGEAVVYAAKNIARSMGLTETLIGLTVVAVGTSLPELVTSAVAVRKGETDLAVGNVVGSGIFNMMFILGVSSSISPITANMASIWDLIILIAVSLLVWVFSYTKQSVNRKEGIVLMLLYVADMVFAVIR